MKIKRWNKEDLKNDDNDTCESGSGTMIVISQKEAMIFIRCLSNQLLNEEGSSLGRKEFFDDNGEYFSIVVDPQIENKVLHHCPNCGGVLRYQDEDADGPCDQWVCAGWGEKKGCWQYFSPDEFISKDEPESGEKT